MNLAAASLAAREAAARIDARNRTKLLKRFRKQGIADEGEANALVDEWKHAARPTKHLQPQARSAERTLIAARKARAPTSRQDFCGFQPIW